MTNSFKRSVATVAGYFIVLMASAQDSVAALDKPVTDSTDSMILYLLISGCATLLIAVFLLGNVWVNLAKLVLEKQTSKTLLLLFLIFCSNILFAQNNSIPPTEAVFKLPVSTSVVFGVVVFVVELLVVIWMLFSIRHLLNELSPATEQRKPFVIHLPQIFDNINASVSIEKEKDILLDHNYDGIRELDNSLPPWWKYSFYISIVWSFFYLGYYYFGGGASSYDEYQAEVLLAKLEVEEYNRKNALNVDETNVKLAEVSGIAEGGEIFKMNCAACHGNAGEGNAVGPNLTDDYWLHGGSLPEVFKSVKYGWPAKGMKSWQTDLSPVQIKNVASYIHSLRGTNPANAKAPQGDLTTTSNTENVASQIIVDSSVAVTR